MLPQHIRRHTKIKKNLKIGKKLIKEVLLHNWNTFTTAKLVRQPSQITIRNSS